MIAQAQEQALRALVAALLASGLPADELRQTVRLLTSDARFAARLRSMIEAVLGLLPEDETGKDMEPRSRWSHTDERNHSAESYADDLLQVLDSVRVTKQELLARLNQHELLHDWKPNPAWSRRRIIQELERMLPTLELSRVVAAIAASKVSSDPYVEGIAARLKDNSNE